MDSRITAEKKRTTEDDLITRLRRMCRLLSVKEAALILKKHPETIYRMIHDQRLAAVLDGARWKIDPQRLADYIARRSVNQNML